MKSFNYARAVQAALIGIAITGSVTVARADIKDYEFQLVDQTVKKGDAIISVRLVHQPDRKPVLELRELLPHSDSVHTQACPETCRVRLWLPDVPIAHGRLYDSVGLLSQPIYSLV